jgi:tyrosine-protein kinase Etk/Wzc
MQGSEKTKRIAGEEINLLHYLVVVLKRKKLILGITLSSALITAVVSLIMTPIYRAETRILPPQQSSSSLSAQVLSQLGGASGFIGSSLGVKNPNDIYVGMLKSRTIYDRIVDRFELMKLYEAEYREDARGELDDLVNVQSGKDEIISVSVEDEDPKRAAEMANAFVEELKELTQNLAVTEASHRRLFFEEQLQKVKEDLIKAEEDMQRFQEKTGAIQVKEQAEAVIESIAELRAKIAAKEVELKVMRTYAKQKNPDLQRAEEELVGMKEQLKKLEVRSGRNPDPLVPTGKLPKVGTEYIRKLRELKYQESLFDLMAKQYEIARVDEARDATLIQVLDKAVPAGKRAKPKRTLMVVVAAFTSFFFAVFVAFFMEYMERVSDDPKNRELLGMLRRHASLGRRRS